MAFELSWEAPEYEYREKSVSWYWTSIIIAAALIAFAVWQRNFLFGFFIVVAEMLFLVWGSNPPRTITFVANTEGISMRAGGSKEYRFREFESMSVNQIGDGWSEMIFVFRARFRAPFRFLVPDAELEALRAHLRTILRETPYEPTFLDSIEKLLGF